MEEHILQSLPHGGAVAAVIVITVVFLRRQKEYDDRLQTIVGLFRDEVAAARRDYLEHLRELTGRPTKPRG